MVDFKRLMERERMELEWSEAVARLVRDASGALRDAILRLESTDMASYSNAKSNKGKGKEFPETLRVEPGMTVVGMALEIERDIVTEYGKRDVCRIIRRETGEGKMFTLWWPRRIPLPNLLTPFILKRTSEKEYSAIFPDDEDEAKLIWSTGEAPGGAVANGDGVPIIDPNAAKAAKAMKRYTLPAKG
jgi:hypothetical protein